MRKHLTKRTTVIRYGARALGLSALLWPPLAVLSPSEAASAATALVRAVVRFTPFSQALTPARGTNPAGQRRRYVQRVNLFVSGSHEIFFPEPVVSATIIDQQTASAGVRDGQTVVVKGLAVGETVLVVATRDTRTAYAVAVTRPPATAARKAALARAVGKPESYGGSYSLSFSPGFQGAPSFLRQTFEARRGTAGGQLFRVGADLSKYFDGGPDFGRPPELSLGADRLTLGFDSAGRTLDLLDSELNVSTLGFRGFTARGFHLVTRGESAAGGVEAFAGLARPSPALFDGGEGRLAGLLVPVAGGDAWRIRAGAVWVSPGVDARGAPGGVVFQGAARYAPGEQLSAEAEAAYADGGLSWRAGFDAQVGDFKFRGESLKVDKNSPYISVGAQPGGRTVTSLGARWQRWRQLAAHATFRRTKSEPPAGLRRAPLDGRTLTAGASLRAGRGSHFGLSFTRQLIETPARGASGLLWRLRTSGATLKYSQQFGRRWANDFETRFTSSAEAEVGAGIGRGVQMREQLRFNWRGGSVTGDLRYTDNAPSLAGLVIRNPSLLPAGARAAFESDPVGFLITNRLLLPQLLPGAELPLTRGVEAGARLQASRSRFDFVGEARYGAGMTSGLRRRDLYATAGLSARLDAANTVRVSGSRLFGHTGRFDQTTLTVSFFHRFGAEGRGGLSLVRLLGLDRGRIRGRVFLDLDADGQDDAGEPGIAGWRVELDGSRAVTTDASGAFEYDSATPGEHTVALVSDKLGQSYRASVPTEQRVYVGARNEARVAFGLNDFGSVYGQVFNDLLLAAHSAPSDDMPGVGGVRLLLRPASNGGGAALTQTAGAGGAYEFRNVPPGAYTLEVDAATLPPDFRLHAGAAWPLTVSPLRGGFVGAPVAAQRAVAGFVFAGGSGLAGVVVAAAGAETTTGADGSYLLRRLPAGRVVVRAVRPDGAAREVTVEMEAGPSIRRNLNITF